MSQPQDIEQLLEAESCKANAIALTQATQLSATQRSLERSRIRDAVASIPREQVLKYIHEVVPGDATAKQFSLLLYSLSNVLPEDTQETMSTCQERLEAYMLAILGRIVADPSFSPHSQLICRLAKNALDGVGQNCSNIVIGLALDAVSKQAQVAPLLIDLLPVALGHICHGSSDADESALRNARAQEVVKRLCSLKWPDHLTPAILVALRDVKLTQSQEQQVLQAALTVCSRMAAEHLAAAAYQTMMLPCSASPVPKLQALCQLMDDHRVEASVKGPAHVSQVLAAQGELLSKLNTLFTRDKMLTNGWLKDFKRGKPSSVTAFALTVNIVAISRSSAVALDALKAVITNALKHIKELEGSPWLAHLSGTFSTALRSLGMLMLAVVKSADAQLAPTLVQVAMHLISAGKLKGVSIGQLTIQQNDAEYSGLQWWTVPCPSSARLCLAGVALLDQVPIFPTF
jgi:hypothetical protein